jgi:hypothetical protein
MPMPSGIADQRIMLLRNPLPGKKFRIGTGTLISDRLVLTAAHVVFGDDGFPLPKIKVGRAAATGPPSWRGLVTGNVAWPQTYSRRAARGRRMGLALVEITDAKWRPSEQLSGPARFGVLTGRAAGVQVEAVGFPRALCDPDGQRVEDHLSGRINPLGGRSAHRYDLSLDTSVPKDPNGWKGASGAGVFARGLLTAVLDLDTGGYDHHRLSAIPAHRILAVAAARRVLIAHAVIPHAQSVELAELLQTPVLAMRNRPYASKSPASLLRPEAEIVKFTGRRPILQQLASWCGSGPPVDARLVVGPGGQGKTRLAREVLAGQVRHGWVCGFLRPDPPAPYSPLDLEPFVDTASDVPGLLIAVDYAEKRVAQLHSLLYRLSGSTSTVRVRLLLMARSSGDWWNELSNRYPNLLEHATEIPLAGLNVSSAEKKQAFNLALRSFLAPAALPAIYKDLEWRAIARHVRPPAQLDDDAYNSPLTMQLSALVSLLEAAQILRSGAGDEFEKILLAHEQRYWNDTADAAGLPFKELYQRPTLSYFVAAANLFGARTEADAKHLLGRLPAWPSDDQVIRGIVDWVHRLYPPNDGESYWGTLQPDRVAEYHLRALAQQQSDLLELLFCGATTEEAHQAEPLLSRATRAEGQLIMQLDKLILRNDIGDTSLFRAIVNNVRYSVGRSRINIEPSHRLGRVTTSTSVDLNWQPRIAVPSVSIQFFDKRV